MRQVALVTGGAVRVGRAITMGLAEAGYDMAIHYHTSGVPAVEAAHRVQELGRRALTVGADLGRPEAADELADAVRSEYGRLDLLVNNEIGRAHV